MEIISKAMEAAGTTGLSVNDKAENTCEQLFSKTRKNKYGKTQLDFQLLISQLMA